MRISPARFLLAALLGTGLVVTSCMPSGPSRPAADASYIVARVIDGDTVDMACPDAGAFRARLTGFDTPESYEPGCPAEAALAARATDRLRAMVRAAARVDAELGGLDRYGRRLVRLRLDGVDVAEALIGAGLAVRYSGGRRIDWCTRIG